MKNQRPLLLYKGNDWAGPLAQERSAFVSYLHKKWTKEKVFAFLDSLERSVPSLCKEFDSLKESFNFLIGFVRNYLEKDENPNNSLFLGLSTDLRKNKFSLDSNTFTRRNCTLVSGCQDYFTRLGEDFPYNHKTFRQGLFHAFRELEMEVNELLFFFSKNVV